MSMKSLFRDAIALALLLVLFCIGKDNLPWISVLIVCIIWLYRNRDCSVIAVATLMAVICIPRWSSAMPQCTQAEVISVSASSATLQNGRQRFTVYTDEMLIPDQIYSFDACFEPVQSSSHFFTSSYSDYLKQQGVYWKLTSQKLTLQKKKTTVRSILYEKILETDDESKTIYLRTLLNITEKDIPYSWLDLYGFSFSGIILVTDGLLKYMADQKKRTIIRIVLELFLYTAFACPLIILLHLCKDVLQLTSLDRYGRCGWSLIIPLLVSPYAYCSMAYIITAVYRICSVCMDRHTVWPYVLTLCANASIYGKSYPLLNLLYRRIMVLSGLIWYINIICLFAGIPLYMPLYDGIQLIISGLQKCCLIGSIKGAGFFFFAVFLLTFRHHTYFDRIVLVTYVIFTLTGLFHPFMELSFINVGQGDAILVRAPFAMADILIDTGKPSAFQTVDTFLSAKGITKLDAMIITHPDDDHAGNMEAIIQKYHPKQIITEHVSSFTVGPFVFYDLNTISDENENRSSIMNWFTFNGMKVMLCGDGDETSEETIVRTYGSLDVDLLKVGHHGSSTSSSDLFLDALRPETAVISAGNPSLYHHPSQITVQRLLSRHIPYVNTYEKGDITIVAIWKWNILMTSDGMISILSNKDID